jgi:hypothetical protein
LGFARGCWHLTTGMRRASSACDTVGSTPTVVLRVEFGSADGTAAFHKGRRDAGAIAAPTDAWSSSRAGVSAGPASHSLRSCEADARVAGTPACSSRRGGRVPDVVRAARARARSGLPALAADDACQQRPRGNRLPQPPKRASVPSGAACTPLARTSRMSGYRPSSARSRGFPVVPRRDAGRSLAPLVTESRGRSGLLLPTWSCPVVEQLQGRFHAAGEELVG